MNKIIKFASIIIVFVFFSTLILANNKIAIVNIAKILKYMPQIKEIETHLENEFKERFYNLQNQEILLKEKIKNFKKKNIKINNNDKNEEEIGIIKEKEYLSVNVQNFEKDHNKRYNEERNKILILIKSIITNFAKKEDINVIIDINSIVYADDKKDITISLIEQII